MRPGTGSGNRHFLENTGIGCEWPRCGLHSRILLPESCSLWACLSLAVNGWEGRLTFKLQAAMMPRWHTLSGKYCSLEHE